MHVFLPPIVKRLDKDSAYAPSKNTFIKSLSKLYVRLGEQVWGYGSSQ